MINVKANMSYKWTVEEFTFLNEPSRIHQFKGMTSARLRLKIIVWIFENIEMIQRGVVGFASCHQSKLSYDPFQETTVIVSGYQFFVLSRGIFPATQSVTFLKFYLAS